MANIPSKQLIRAGDLATLQEKLIERELGLCTTDRLLYVKYGDELIPAGDGAVPVPTSKSLFMGEEDGTSGWTSVVKAKSPYDADAELWVSLDGIGFAADVAYKDAEGNPIRSNTFESPRVSPVNGHLILTNEENSHFVSVRIGNKEDALGGLIPYDRPSSSDPEEQVHFSQGDLLVVEGDFGFPSLVWKHPDTFPVENSKYPVTSGAVYGVRHLIDPNLYDPNTGESMTIEGTGLSYTKGWYYVFGDSLFICDSATSTQAEFTGVDGLVIALNYTLDKIPPVAIYEYEKDTNLCRDSAGHSVKATDILTAMAEGKIPLMLSRTSRGATVCGTALAVSGETTVLFRESPRDDGSFMEYSNDSSADTYDWTATTKSISGVSSPVFVATYGTTTQQELDAAYTAGQFIVLICKPTADRVVHMTLTHREYSSASGAQYYFSSAIDSGMGLYYSTSMTWSEWNAVDTHNM